MKMDVTFSESNNGLGIELDNGCISDDVISKKHAWSSKNTIDKLCPSFTKSGAIVTCEPVEGYPLTVTTDAETATVTRLGLNLLPYPYANTTQTTNGIDFTDNGDGSITANGTATADATFLLYNGNLKYPFSTILGIGFSGCPSGGGTSAYYISNEWCGLFDFGGGCQVAPTASHAIQTYWCSHFQIVIKKGYTANNLVFKPCLYYGSAVKGYGPYRGKETFNPGKTIPALPGVNTIFADVGEVTVSGKADPVAIINKLVGNV